MRNSILFALTLLLLPICSPRASKSLLKVEEGDEGSADPVITDIQKVNPRRVTPDDTESSGDDGDDGDDVDNPDTEVISGGGSGTEDGSGSGEYPGANSTIRPSYKTDIRVKTTARVDIINDPDRNQTTTKRTTTKLKDDLIVTTLGNIVENPVDPSANHTVISPSENNPLPSVRDKEEEEEEEEEDNSDINFTVAIIVGVVVGAILSILIIVFLVYRLRKKDEGSYCLDEPSSVMLRNDTNSPPPKGDNTKGNNPYLLA